MPGSKEVFGSIFAATGQTSLDGYFEDMLSAEYFGSFFDAVPTHTESNEVHKTAVFEIKSQGATLVMNASLNATETAFVPELFYRHTMAMTAVYCVAYLLVFALGLVGNFFVIAVVFRSPRMRTVTNFFIVNLAVADILVIVFCLPATLMSNIFVRKYCRIFDFVMTVFHCLRFLRFFECFVAQK